MIHERPSAIETRKNMEIDRALVLIHVLQVSPRNSLTIVAELARLIVPGHKVMVLRPIALRDNENQIRIRLLHVFVEAPEQMGSADHPSHVDDDNVAQREGDKKGRLHSVIPILEGRIDGQ